MPLLHNLRQMVLDWCDTPAAAPSADATARSAGHAPPQPVPPALPPLPDAASHLRALPDMLHPQANRHVVLEHQVVGYMLRRSRRRTVGMRIAEAGLEVAAPAWVAQGEIERILQQKAGWIVRKLHERQLPQASPARQPLGWGHGMLLDYAGQALHVQLTGTESGPAASIGGNSLKPRQMQALLQRVQMVAAADATHPAQLHVPLPPDAPAEWLQHLLRQWCMQQAHAVFAARIAVYEPLLGVRSQQLTLSNAGSRWGSATSRGVIRLHWRLIQLAPELLDYVVVHELSHLREMNHSPRFWAVVASVLPDYATHRTRLKTIRLHPW